MRSANIVCTELFCLLSLSAQNEYMVGPAKSLYDEPLDPRILFIVTYHNLYAIIIVMMTFIVMDNARLEVNMTFHVFDAL